MTVSTTFSARAPTFYQRQRVTVSGTAARVFQLQQAAPCGVISADHLYRRGTGAPRLGNRSVVVMITRSATLRNQSR